MFDFLKLGKMASGMGDMQAMLKKAQGDERFQRLFSSPAFQDLAKDPEFLAAVQSKNFMKLMGMPKFQKFLNDPEAAAILKDLASSK